MNFYFIISIFISFICISGVTCWDNEELEIFDLVEEINENFYNLLGVSKDAKLPEIKKAFRNQSVILHPDKNSAEDANIKFRNLVSVYEVLKDTSKREKYDEVLKNGLPNWKSAVYYYRHVRKMGMIEMTFILFVIITVGQYIVGWAAYVEKRHTAEKLLGSKIKKSQKKNKAGPGLADILDEIPQPSIKDTLPIQIPRLIWNSIIGIPSGIRAIINYIEDRKRKREEELLWEIEEQQRLEQAKLDAEKAKELRGARRRKPGFTLPEMTDEDYLQMNMGNEDTATKEKPKMKPPPVISGGFWTDDDLTELIRLVKKYPGGTPDRWERIASSMNRTVQEVTHMAAKIKDNSYRISQEQNEVVVPEPPKKVKTKGGKLGEITQHQNAVLDWSQEQQKALESALAKFPKGGVQDRWEKIAHSVPGKTKEDCITRYKYLVELVKKQNQKDQEPKEQDDSENSAKQDDKDNDPNNETMDYETERQ